MTNNELEAIINKKVSERVSAALQNFGIGMSSVSIKPAKEKVSIEVKVYNLDPIRAANQARYVYSKVSEKMGNPAPADDGKPIQHPTDEQLGGYEPSKAPLSDQEVGDRIINKSIKPADAPGDDADDEGSDF